MRIPFPKEHGAWVMLCLSLLAGGILAGGDRIGTSLLAATAGVLGFLAQHALRERLAGRAPAAVSMVLGGSAGAVLVVASRASEHPLWILPPLMAGSAAWALRWFRSRAGRTRMDDLPSHLAGVVALSSLLFLVAMPESTESGAAAFRVWTILSAQFAIGAAVVHARLVGRSAFATGSMLLAPAVALSLYPIGRDPRWLALALAFAFALVFRRAALSRRWPLARTGWMEAVAGLAVCILGAVRWPS